MLFKRKSRDEQIAANLKAVLDTNCEFLNIELPSYHTPTAAKTKRLKHELEGEIRSGPREPYAICTYDAAIDEAFRDDAAVITGQYYQNIEYLCELISGVFAVKIKYRDLVKQTEEVAHELELEADLSLKRKEADSE